VINQTKARCFRFDDFQHLTCDRGSGQISKRVVLKRQLEPYTMLSDAANHITKRGLRNHVSISRTAMESENAAGDLFPELVKSFCL
jgi:hypothetical protein